MKRILCLILTAVLLLCTVSALAEDWTCPACGYEATLNFCASCGAARPADEPAESPAATESPAEEAASAEDVDNGLYAITGEYTWTESDYYFYAAVIKNTSGAASAYRVSVSFVDADGNVVDTATDRISACDDGAEVMVVRNSKTAFDHADCIIEPMELYGYNDVHSFVNVTAQKYGEKVILSAANTGNVDAEAIRFDCLFLDGNGNAVGYEWGYLTDDDNMLRSGCTWFREEDCDSEFDSVRVCFTGETDEDVVCTDTVELFPLSPAIGDNYEVETVYTLDINYRTVTALVIKNDSEIALEYGVQFIYYDEAGQICAVDNDSVRCVDPGREVMIVNTVYDPFTSWEYTVTPVINERYADNCGMAEITSEKTDAAILVNCTYNGTAESNSIHYACVMLDENGSAVGFDSGSLSNSDYKLHPGDIVTSEIDCTYRDPFSSYVIYYDGYAYAE